MGMDTGEHGISGYGYGFHARIRRSGYGTNVMKPYRAKTHTFQIELLCHPSLMLAFLNLSPAKA